MRKLLLSILVLLSILIFNCATTTTTTNEVDPSDLLDSTVTSAYNGKQYKTILIVVSVGNDVLKSRYEQMFEKAFKVYQIKTICSTDAGYTDKSDSDKLNKDIKKYNIDGVLIISSTSQYPDMIFSMTLFDYNIGALTWKATTKVNAGHNQEDEAYSFVAVKTPETMKHDSIIKKAIVK